MVSRTRTQIFDMASKDVGFVLDQEKAIDKGLQSRMDKAQFASRSEAGRYAANMRWKGQGKKGKGNTDTAQLIAYRQAGNTKDAKLTEQKIEQRLAAEGKTSPAERMAAGLRDFKGKTAEPKGIKVDFRPEDPEPTRNDVGDLSAAKNIVRKFENNLNSLKETTGIKGKRMKEWKAVCNLDGAKKAAKAATKEECAKVIRDYEEKGMKTYKEYEYANFRVKSGSQIGNNVVRQKMVAMRDNNEAYSRDAFDRAAGATEVFEARFGESISSYPESN